MKLWPMVLSWLVLGCEASVAPPQPAQITPASVTWKQPPCSEIFSRYRETLAAGKGACRTDSDCVRYGGVDPENVCGGMTDADTARKLKQIADEPAGSVCPKPPYSCPALPPRCLDGLCR